MRSQNPNLQERPQTCEEKFFCGGNHFFRWGELLEAWLGPSRHTHALGSPALAILCWQAMQLAISSTCALRGHEFQSNFLTSWAFSMQSKEPELDLPQTSGPSKLPLSPDSFLYFHRARCLAPVATLLGVQGLAIRNRFRRVGSAELRRL